MMSTDEVVYESLSSPEPGEIGDDDDSFKRPAVPPDHTSTPVPAAKESGYGTGLSYGPYSTDTWGSEDEGNDGKLLLNPAYADQEHRPLSLDERLDQLTSEGSSGVADEEDLGPRSSSVRHHPVSSPAVVPRAETPPVRVRRIDELRDEGKSPQWPSRERSSSVSSCQRSLMSPQTPMQDEQRVGAFSSSSSLRMDTEVGRHRAMQQSPRSPADRWLKNFELEDAKAYYRSASAVVRRRREPRGDDSPVIGAEDAYDNPAWDAWKKADTDTKRKQLAMQQFANKDPGNPNRCMTFTGYRRTLTKREVEMRSDAEYETWLPLSKSTDVRLEDGAVHFLSNVGSNKNSGYAFGQKRRRDSGFVDFTSEGSLAKRQKTEGDTMDFDKFKNELISILYKTKSKAWMVHDSLRRDGGRKQVEREMKFFLEHFKGSERELENFATYYREGQGGLKMTTKDLETFSCTENLFARMAEVYGQSETINCKDCAAKHDVRELRHRV